MERRIEVTGSNLLHIDFCSVVALTFASPGAMGEAGGVEFSALDGTWYHFNYLHGSVSIEQFHRAFPGSPTNLPDLPDDWHEFYLGVGNTLFFHDQVYKKYRNSHHSSDPEDIMLWWRSTLGSPILSRKERYMQLVERAKKSYSKAVDGLVWCDTCQDEINLWTYWQGQGHLEPDILVVGQDWGNPDSKIGRVCLRNIVEHRPYLEQNTFPSDQNLALLFQKALNIDLNLPNEKLFFTNFVLGYRTGNNTGPLKVSHFTHDLDRFKTLVHILKPKIVICLGQNTFTYALRAFGEKKFFSNGYADALNRYDNYLDIDDIRFYGMAHCGNYGCKNRGGDIATGLALQIEDWRQIREK